ncbi:MAG: metal-dependent hydrolase YbeY [Segetibacter sp.]|nr:metal-dependent hydrolase YbeY [Segetibacter sp.]
MANVRFSYADVKPISLPGKKALKEFIKRLFSLEGKTVLSINYVFCSDPYLLEINKSFLQHDYLTDIITFDLSEGELVESEVYISVDRVRENALIHNTVYRTELLRVMFHGALHLCGYRDKKKSEITIMREKEESYLRLFEQS